MVLALKPGLRCERQEPNRPTGGTVPPHLLSSIIWMEGVNLVIPVWLSKFKIKPIRHASKDAGFLHVRMVFLLQSLQCLMNGERIEKESAYSLF